MSDEKYIGTTFASSGGAFNLVSPAEILKNPELLHDWSKNVVSYNLEDQPKLTFQEFSVNDKNVLKNELGIVSMFHMIEFPKDFPESERIKICKMLKEKDDEISRLDKEVLSLENKLGKYNGGLTYGETEKLKTQMNILQFTSNSINRELNNFNLKMVQYYPKGSPHVYEIKLEKDKTIIQLLFNKLANLLKSLMPFDVKLKKRNLDL